MKPLSALHRHFILKGLPVPEIFGYIPEKFVYYLEDLGDMNLFTWLHQPQQTLGFNKDTEEIYRKVLDKLIEFQIKGIDGSGSEFMLSS